MWCRFDDQITHHPKILAVGVRAAHLYFAGIIYCGRYRTDGFIPEEALPILAPLRDYRRLARKLVEVRVPGSEHGLWEKVDGGFQVHDFLKYNPSAASVAKREEADRQRLRAARGHGGQEDAAGVEQQGDYDETTDSSGGLGTTQVAANASMPQRLATVIPTGGAPRRGDVATRSVRRRSVPSPSPIPIPDRSRDHEPVCAQEPRAPAREGHTHGSADEISIAEQALAAPEAAVAAPEDLGALAEAPAPSPVADEVAALGVLQLLRAMPPPVCYLATPEYAERFAAARLAGLGPNDIRRAITAAAMKLGNHKDARQDDSAALTALADHVGAFLAHQTPSSVAPEPQRRRADPAAVDRFLDRWREHYARAEGATYTVTDEDREHAAELVVLIGDAAREHATSAGIDAAGLEERIAERWIRAYLRDEGVNGYLVKARHVLRYMKRGVATYGIPQGPRKLAQRGQDERQPSTSAPALSASESAARAQEVMLMLDAPLGPGVAKVVRPGAAPESRAATG